MKIHIIHNLSIFENKIDDRLYLIVQTTVFYLEQCYVIFPTKVYRVDIK